MDLTSLLSLSVNNQASDLHLSAGLPPMLRVHGDVHRIGLEVLSNSELSDMLHSIMGSAQRAQFDQTQDLDFALDVAGLSRFRVNAFVHNRGLGVVFRTIPSIVPSLAELNAPSLFSELALLPRGLVLVTGPTGSGKSTTLAAMLRHRNELTHSHILTVEDPIEFVHTPQQSLVNQREVGRHTQGFSSALRAALREDPDVILVGELRDLETIRLALTAAETGHLVLATVHTSSAPKTIDRLVDVFPAEEKDMVRAMLSESLQGVVAQTQLKTKDAKGRVAAHEIMVGTPAIRNLIREGKVAQMYSTLQTGSSAGMQTLDQHLTDLVRRGMVSPAEARSKARMPENFPG